MPDLWEYSTLEIRPDSEEELAEKMNAMGVDGWEGFAVSTLDTDPPHFLIFFKKSLEHG